MSGDELRAYGDQVVDRLLRENQNRWHSLGPADRLVVEQVAREVAARLLEEPARRLDAGHPLSRDQSGAGHA
jgi:hypothetical protein